MVSARAKVGSRLRARYTHMTKFNADGSVFVPSSVYGKIIFAVAERMFNAEVSHLRADEFVNQFYDLSKVVTGKNIAITKPQLAAKIEELKQEAMLEDKVPVVTSHRAGKAGGIYLGWGPEHKGASAVKGNIVAKLAAKGEAKIKSHAVSNMAKCLSALRLFKASEDVRKGLVDVKEFDGANAPYDDVYACEVLQAALDELKVTVQYAQKKVAKAKGVTLSLPAANLDELIEAEGEEVKEDSSSSSSEDDSILG